MITNYLYVVHTPKTYYTAIDIETAQEYSDRNNGFCIQSKTKDLFPTYKTVWVNKKPSGRLWFIINLKEV